LHGLDVDQARQVPGTLSGLREALATEVLTGLRDRRSAPAVEQEYGIEAVTARIDDLYERLAARAGRGRLAMSGEAARGRRLPGGAEPIPDTPPGV
jgi:hypothetical protein